MSVAMGQQRLAASLQGALTEAEVTSAYLSAVPSVIGARGYGFYRFADATDIPAAVVADVSAEFLADYEERGRAGDPVLDFVRQNLRAVDETRACPPSAWQEAPVHEVLRDAGFHHSLEAPVVASGQLIGTINFARAMADRPFTAADLREATVVAEQLGLAVERALRYERTCARTAMFEAAFDRMPQAVVVTDLDGNLRYANRAATRPAAGPAGTGPPAAGPASPGPAGGAGESLLAQASPQIAVALAAFRDRQQRVSVSAGGTAQVIVKSVRLPGDPPAVLTIIYPADKEGAGLPLWNLLSPREQQIADWVSQGLTTKQIAQRAVVTENTVKQHLKRIFAKTDSANRAELVQRVWAARQLPQLPD